MTRPAPLVPAHPSIDLTPYAGRWIAIVHDHVAGVALTPREAKVLAKLSRPKDEPIVLFVPAAVRDRMAR